MILSICTIICIVSLCSIGYALHKRVEVLEKEVRTLLGLRGALGTLIQNAKENLITLH